MATVLITGAGRGIGLHLARHYVAAGWTVLAGMRRPDAAKDVPGRIVQLDVSDAGSVASAARVVDAVSIDLLINNAGLGARRGEALGSVDYPAFARMLDVNVLGPVRMIEAFAGHLARGERKQIVTVSSRMGSIGEVGGAGSMAYRTSKAAVNMAMRSLSFELGPRGLTLVVVHPGWVRTDMGGPSAPLMPEQSAAALAKLIERLTPADNGRFYNYDGTPLPW
ncbi:MAG: SDR family oxidoreductase [Alphaproteobacteria bacterium]|nr:SDR family oxidoreductase [Alphaproteobacteria bacterium]